MWHLKRSPSLLKVDLSIMWGFQDSMDVIVIQNMFIKSRGGGITDPSKERGKSRNFQ